MSKTTAASAKSWKTTVCGIGCLLAAVSAILLMIGGAADLDFAAVVKPFLEGLQLLGVLSGGTGLLLARDADKSSEESGVN